MKRRVCPQTTGISKPPSGPSALWDTRHTAGKSPRQKHSSIFIPCLSECVCGFFHLCLYWAFFCSICLFVYMFGQSHLEAGGCPSSLCVKWLPRNLVSAGLFFSRSGQQPGLRCWLALLLAWLTTYVPVALRQQEEEHLGVGSEAGFYQAVNQSQGERRVCHRTVH